MIIDSGWGFISLATLRWGDTMGTAARQFVVLGDHHWWFYGTKDLATDPRQDPSAWAQEVLSHADEDYVRYLAVVMEVPSARIDYPEPRRLTPGTGPTPSPAPSDAEGSVHA
ncbi:hypothetical protein [Microbacterium dauci]|uniref:Uncharacterized protein n=1 Tax=Microbacterium dauci TaxID=3048008 RepID=A0ABT6ZCA0_9MICO|nr:hypothetical protein [Microbacterium sp. LX3-4]MDJ1113779.1 hypothetical protein [Microbacterium sp. LX3-4]